MKEPTFTKRLMGVTGGLSQSFLHITVGAGFSDIPLFSATLPCDSLGILRHSQAKWNI